MAQCTVFPHYLPLVTHRSICNIIISVVVRTLYVKSRTRLYVKLKSYKNTWAYMYNKKSYTVSSYIIIIMVICMNKTIYSKTLYTSIWLYIQYIINYRAKNIFNPSEPVNNKDTPKKITLLCRHIVRSIFNEIWMPIVFVTVQ